MKNIRKSIVIALMLLGITITNAQDGSKREKMEALKVAFITEKLDLSSAESKAFWPIYNEFQEKRKAISKGMRRPEGPPPENGNHKRPKAPNFDEMTDTQIAEFIDDIHKREEEMLNLKVEYFTKYKKVLPIRKIGELMTVEKEFRKEVLKKLKENHR